MDDASKGVHGVFLEDGVDLTNNAWARAQKLGLSPNEAGELIVPMGRQVGWLGGQFGQEAAIPLNKVRIILVPGSGNQIIISMPY